MKKPKIDRILLYPKSDDGCRRRVLFIRGAEVRTYHPTDNQYARLVKTIKAHGGRFNRGFPKAWILAR